MTQQAFRSALREVAAVESLPRWRPDGEFDMREHAEGEWIERASVLEILREATTADAGQTDLRGLLVNVSQLLDGWHQDGTAWTEWDESVRRDVSEYLSLLNASEPSMTCEWAHAVRLRYQQRTAGTRWIDSDIGDLLKEIDRLRALAGLPPENA